jgi:hypothetical protein
MSRHMVRGLMKEGTASRVSTRINPALTAKNKLRRVESALIYIDEYLLIYLIQSIKDKWPTKDRSRPIMIQQDNATPHVSPFDTDIVAAGSADGWFIQLIFQPPNSPDYNALDLGLFASIQVHPVSVCNFWHRQPHRCSRSCVRRTQYDNPRQLVPHSTGMHAVCAGIKWRKRVQDPTPVEGKTTSSGTAASCSYV